MLNGISLVVLGLLSMLILKDGTLALFAVPLGVISIIETLKSRKEKENNGPRVSKK